MITNFETKIIQDHFDREHGYYNKRKVMFAIAKRDQELKAEAEYNRNNVCPKCYIVMPTSGICDCGYCR